MEDTEIVPSRPSSLAKSSSKSSSVAWGTKTSNLEFATKSFACPDMIRDHMSIRHRQIRLSVQLRSTRLIVVNLSEFDPYLLVGKSRRASFGTGRERSFTFNGLRTSYQLQHSPHSIAGILLVKRLGPRHSEHEWHQRCCGSSWPVVRSP